MTKKPLAIWVTPDVPFEAITKLHDLGHTVRRLLDETTPASGGILPTSVCVTGGTCWRMPISWWMKDSDLSSTAKTMLKGMQAAVYPAAPKKVTTPRKRRTK